MVEREGKKTLGISYYKTRNNSCGRWHPGTPRPSFLISEYPWNSIRSPFNLIVKVFDHPQGTFKEPPVLEKWWRFSRLPGI